MTRAHVLVYDAAMIVMRLIGRLLPPLSMISLVLLLVVLLMRPVGAILPGNDVLALEVGDNSVGLARSMVYYIDVRSELVYPFPLQHINSLPVFSPDGEQIAYVPRDDPAADIYVADWMGRNVRNITNHPAIETMPVFSPDGTHLAFVSFRDGVRQLFIADLITGEVQPVFDNLPDPVLFLDVQWSPDNRELLVRNNEGLYLVNVASATSQMIAGDDVAQAGWSPDGQQIAYAISPRDSEVIPFDLFVMERGSDAVVLDSELQCCSETLWSWSADGQTLLYTIVKSEFDKDIVITPINGGDRINLSDHPESDNRPMWSPDGEQILFTSERDDQADVYIMNSDGGNLRNLTSHPSIDSNLAWSPDGQQILFGSNRDFLGLPGVFLMNADGNNARLLFSAYGFVRLRMWRQ